ncbi:hypothetical protein [Planobispora takensis]|uniref:Uncharacterized protein n=1 Tax=Planobispora takensis TaxID=1367882 RepID=A0A8J3TCG1_9ACTN|nr:hypothetical protein [Planobispora takensis]GII04849.1 hypothetical protein Pta02_68570 [Planobispora takensis]
MLLAEQDRARWDRAAIEEAIALLTRTARVCRRPGPYQLQDLGRRAEARRADVRASELTANPAQQVLLEERLTWT